MLLVLAGVPMSAYGHSFSPDPRVAYASFWGGSGAEGCEPTVGRDGSIYVTCGTDSPNLPRVGRGSRPYQGQEDGFIAKLNRSGASLDWATYLGGSDFDGLSPTLRVDRKGHLDIVGSTASTDFPVRRGRP